MRAGLARILAETLIGNDRGIHRAVRYSGRNCRATRCAEKSALKRSDVRRIGADQFGNAARHDVAEDPKARAKYGIWFELPRNRRARLKDCDWRGREQIAEMSLDRRVQWLIDIMGDRIEGTCEAADLLVRIQRIGIESIRRPMVQVSWGVIFHVSCA